ncbi:UPF0104 family protein [bacterium]|nr:MAG: UPF0104 family protein [bacterium]
MTDSLDKLTAAEATGFATKPSPDIPLKKTKPGKTLFRIFVTLAVLALLFWQVSWQSVWRALQSLNAQSLLLVCLLWIPTQGFQYLRWAYLAKQAGPAVDAADIHRGYWVGYTLGLMTPGRIGTYGRALALKNCSLARAAGLTIVERNYSAFVLNGLGLITLVWLPYAGWNSFLPQTGTLVSALLVLGGVLLIGLGIFPSILAKWLRRIVHRLPLGEKLDRALEAVQGISARQGILLSILALCALCSSLLQFVLIVRGMGIELPYITGMLAVLLNFFLKGNIPISIGNIGVGEWTAMICLAGLGVEASIAVAASLLLFFINVFIPSLIGLPYLTSLRVPPSLKRQSA